MITVIAGKISSGLESSLVQGPIVAPPLIPVPAEVDGTVHARVNTLAAFDRLYIRSPRPWLVALLIAYLVGGSLFAYYTPNWQAPDEPAHYNYIAHIATTVTLPVLQMGDYNQQKLDNLLKTNFLRRLSPAVLRYEFYQPPLYYLLATPIYWASNGSVFYLRLFGVLLGALTVVLLYLCLVLVFPGKTLIPLGAAAFSALLPMHMAMSASINNDGLSELLLMAMMLVLLQWMRRRFYGEDSQASQTHQLLWIGLLLGLGMLTKIYAYLILPLVVAVVVVITWLSPRLRMTPSETEQRSPSRASFVLGLQRSLWVVVPAILLALPTWIRNVWLYGGWDLLGLAWHDQVVAGQPRTDAWIADVGWIAYSERAFSFTFQSFWGVFGWMSVFMDERIYTALLIFTGVIFLGVLWASVRFISGGPDTDMDVFQLSVLILFGLMLVVVTLGYLGYNLKFVQHQGRYFFWGLLPIGTVVALGWREVLQPLQGAITGFMATVLAIATAVSGTVTGDMNKWTVLSIGLIALVLLCQPLLLGGVGPDTLRWLPVRVRQWMARPRVAWLLRLARSLVWALPFILLFVLDLAIPHMFIVPMLD
jgi:hypothetical protein